jgi:hypothetical protein
MRRLTILACFMLVLTLGATNCWAVTIGDSTTPAGLAIGSGSAAVSPGLVVPVGGGVVTELAAQLRASTAAVKLFRLLVVSGTTPTFTVVGGVDATLSSVAGAYQRVAVATRIPVQAGDALGGYAPPGGNAVLGLHAVGSNVQYLNPASEPADGTSFTTTNTTGSPFELAMSATVEPDADGDGFGDDTQDACPNDPAAHVAPCPVGVNVTLAASPTTIVQGDVSTLVATVGGTGQGASLALALPAGLALVTASSTAGDCTPAPVACPLGTIDPSAPRKVYAVVRGVASGAQAVSVNVSQSGVELVPDDNAAALTLNVTRAAAPPVTKLCKVPKLKGRTAAAAATALRKAGCRTGTVRNRTAHKGRVSSQTVPAGLTVIGGTKVGYTVRAPARKKAKRRKHR